MPPQETVSEVKKQLEEVVKGNSEPLDASYLEDYAKIGSLLSDKETCMNWLKRLDSRLRPAARFMGMCETDQFKNPLNRLKTVEYSGRQIVVHNQLLTSYFRDWENLEGFNQETDQKEGGLPARVPHLMDFVHPDDFRNYLLKHGYHWLDAGVGGRHGEFTHRLHWYIIIEHDRATKGWLTHPPLKLFKMLGESSTVGAKTTLWDAVVDNLSADTFRSPEVLHAEVQRQRNSKDLWCLGGLIWGRAEQRRADGRTKLAADLQQEVQDRQTEYIVRGNRTGLDQLSNGTIVWKPDDLLYKVNDDPRIK